MCCNPSAKPVVCNNACTAVSLAWRTMEDGSTTVVAEKSVKWSEEKVRNVREDVFENVRLD